MENLNVVVVWFLLKYQSCLLGVVPTLFTFWFFFLLEYDNVLKCKVFLQLQYWMSSSALCCCGWGSCSLIYSFREKCLCHAEARRRSFSTSGWPMGAFSSTSINLTKIAGKAHSASIAPAGRSTWPDISLHRIAKPRPNGARDEKLGKMVGFERLSKWEGQIFWCVSTTRHPSAKWTLRNSLWSRKKWNLKQFRVMAT